MKELIWLLAGLVGTGLLVPLTLPFLRRLKFGQFVRDDGPESHLKKAGTPTMGGLVFGTVFTLLTGLVMVLEPERAKTLLPILLVTLGFGLVGFIDDYIKVVKKRSMGFKAKHKLLAQILICLLYIVYLWLTSDQISSILVPFTRGYYIDLGWLYLPFVFIFMLGTVNGANLTDGIDGLATSVTIAILGFFLLADIMMGYGVSYILAIGIGVLFGFLLYNSHPAALFMGDTGSLALGGLVAATAIYMHMPLFILFVGLIYLSEVISVILQVGYYKKTKKRIFKMAPIHHHFELSGWKETKVVYVFTIVTIFFCVLTGIFLL